MIVLLMILSALALLALFGALIYFLKKIIMVLDRIGGDRTATLPSCAWACAPSRSRRVISLPR